MRLILNTLTSILILTSCNNNESGKMTPERLKSVYASIEKKQAEYEEKLSRLRVITDLDTGIEVAKKEKKPILLYFTGHAVVSCRKMEQDLLFENNDVLEILEKDYINIWLYVDERKDSLGIKWLNYQSETFKVQHQPYLVILDSNGNPISKGLGYNEAKDELEDLLEEYK